MFKKISLAILLIFALTPIFGIDYVDTSSQKEQYQHSIESKVKQREKIKNQKNSHKFYVGTSFTNFSNTLNLSNFADFKFGYEKAKGNDSFYLQLGYAPSVQKFDDDTIMVITYSDGFSVENVALDGLSSFSFEGGVKRYFSKTKVSEGVFGEIGTGLLFLKNADSDVRFLGIPFNFILGYKQFINHFSIEGSLGYHFTLLPIVSIDGESYDFDDTSNGILFKAILGYHF